KFSLVEQERRIHGVAMVRGESVAQAFSDPGVSGSLQLSRRPGGRDMLAALKSGDVIVAAKLDRLFRSAKDALNTVEDLKEQGVGAILAEIGTERITDNGVSKLFFSMRGAFAEFERNRIAERMDEGRNAKRERGGFIGGEPPFGFSRIGNGRDAVVVENEKE